MASRDADGQKIETFVLEVASQRRCDGRSVPVHFKMNLFGDNECTWDVRLVLEAFYDGTTTAWLTHKVLKNQMNDVAEVLDNAGSSFWAQFTPSRNALVTNPNLGRWMQMAMAAGSGKTVTHMKVMASREF